MALNLEYNLDLAAISRWHMISTPTSLKATLIYAQEIGEFVAGPRYYTSREGFNSFLLHLTLDGQGKLSYNGQSYTLTPGQFFWIDCNDPQSYCTDEDSSNWHFVWIHFYGGNSRAYYEAYLTHNNDLPIGTFPIRSKAVNIFSSLLELDPKTPHQIIQGYKIADYLTQLVSECVLSTMSEATDSDVPQIIQSVRMFLQNNYADKHSLEALGAQFNIHPHYLQKQFKRYVGMSPLEYQIFVRLTKAKELLRDTKKSVGEIAVAVGIDNQGYFTRLFKSQEGMAPLAYRKLWPGLDDVSTERFIPFSRDTINCE